jgi:sugar phosphate isomerase/epimerase
MNTEEALDVLLLLGVKTFEIFFNSPSELKPEFIGVLKEKLEAHGAQVRSLHPFSSMMEAYMFFSDYERRFLDMLEFYENYFKAAELLGADILVIHGDRELARIDEAQYFKRFKALVERGEARGLRVAQENVFGHRSAHSDFLSRFREALGDSAYFVFDVKQAVRSGEKPEDIIKAMGERIVHVHVNDNTEEADCLLPGQGQMDYSELKSGLDAENVNADWIIEVYRSNYKQPEQLKQALELLNNLLSV